MAEYNALARAASEKSQAKKIALLDDFVFQYPNSSLLIYVYPLYYNAYAHLRNFPKVLEYADKLTALRDKAPRIAQYAALCAWTMAYGKMNSLDLALAVKARERSLAGVKILASLEPARGMDEKTLETEKNRGAMHLYLTAAAAALVLKDFASAAESIKAMQDLDSYDPMPFVEPKPHVTGF